MVINTSWMERKAERAAAGKNPWEMSGQKSKNLEKVFMAMNRAGKSGVAHEMSSVFTLMGPASGGFSALGIVLKALEPVIKILSTLFKVFSMGLMKGVMPALKPIIALLIQLAPAFEIVGTAIGWFIKGSLWVLLHVIYGIGLGIAYVVDFIAGILNSISFGLIPRTNAVGGWNALMAPVLSGFQTGSDHVPATGMYMLHQGEQVVSQSESKLARLKEEWHMERQTAALEKLVSIKEGRMY